MSKTTRPTEEYGRFNQNTQLCLWYCGLRGAVAYALAMKAAATLGEPGQAMLSSTLFVVMFTVLLMGGSTTHVLQKLGIIDHAPRFGPGGLNSAGDRSAGSGARGSKSKVDPGGLGKGMANIAGNNPMSPPRPSNKAHTKGSAPGTPGHVTAEHAPLLSESEQAADRRERRHRRGGAYRALRQFDFKYLQPLLLATPMKRLPREERPGRGGKGGGPGDGSSSRPGRHSPGYGSGGSSGGGSPERPEGKYSGMSRDASHGDLPDEVFANHSKQPGGSIGSRRATEAEQSYRVFQARDTRVNADGTPMWGTDEV